MDYKEFCPNCERRYDVNNIFDDVNGEVTYSYCTHCMVWKTVQPTIEVEGFGTKILLSKTRPYDFVTSTLHARIDELTLDNMDPFSQKHKVAKYLQERIMHQIRIFSRDNLIKEEVVQAWLKKNGFIEKELIAWDPENKFVND